MRLTDEYGPRIGTVIVGILVAAGLILAAAFFVAFLINSAACGRAGDRLNRATEYDRWAETCYVETDNGTFVPLDNLRVTNEEGER